MPTPRETILTALHARLLALPATALRDGKPGEPEVRLSTLAYGTTPATVYRTVPFASTTLGAEQPRLNSKFLR